MPQETNFRECPGCKIILPITDYPADNRYGVSSPECRQSFDEILVKEGELFGYPPAHRLIIDSAGVQHPPHAEVQAELAISQRFIDASIQSVAIHLIALSLAIDEKIELPAIAKIMDKILSNMNQQKATFPLLAPPKNLGSIRAYDIKKAFVDAETPLTLEQYSQLAWQWAHEAWNAWSAHHATVRKWRDSYR